MYYFYRKSVSCLCRNGLLFFLLYCSSVLLDIITTWFLLARFQPALLLLIQTTKTGFQISIVEYTPSSRLSLSTTLYQSGIYIYIYSYIIEREKESRKQKKHTHTHTGIRATFTRIDHDRTDRKWGISLLVQCKS